MVACIEGAKVVHGLHKAGNKRFGSGLWDDFRSFNGDDNTRLIGDFTKSLQLSSIAKRFNRKQKEEEEWKRQLGTKECPTEFERERLQIRIFELGETYYIGMFQKKTNAIMRLHLNQILQIFLSSGMELPREYDTWKTTKFRGDRRVQQLLDRLWIEAATDVLALGDVFNPGGKTLIPRIHTIDSKTPQKLKKLQAYDAFTLAPGTYIVKRHDPDKGICIGLENGRTSFWVPSDTHGIAPSATYDNPGPQVSLKESKAFQLFDSFEVLSVGHKTCIIRNKLGKVVEMDNTVDVIRLSNLSKGPDGRTSKVAVASFPVAHVACRKIMFRLSKNEYIVVFIGDGQCSPHFMRYSGLTGACINVVSFNNFIGQCLSNVSYATGNDATAPARRDRYQQYVTETNWSSAEVVIRGIGEGYGESAFLRPGFGYAALVKLLRARLEEQEASGLVEDLEDLLNDLWKKNLGASLVPRGLETDRIFLTSLYMELMEAVGKEFGIEVQEDGWSRYLDDRVAVKTHVPNEMVERLLLLLRSIVVHVQQLAREYSRVSSDLYKQPKPVDSIADDFAVEAQNFANGLTMSTAFATFSLSLRLLSETGAEVASVFIGFLSIVISFGTIANVSRYRNRNEEARTHFFDHEFQQLEKDIFGQLPHEDRRNHQNEDDGLVSNPFWKELKHIKNLFRDQAEYYNEHRESIDQLEEAFRHIHADDEFSLETFRMLLVQTFIPTTFQKNSYLQETLVRLYRVTELCIRCHKEMYGGKPVVADIYNALPDFRKNLERSLQRGPIRYGFLRKDLKYYQNPIVAGIQRLFNIPFRSARETCDLWKVLKQRSMTEVPALRRSCLAMRQLHFATVESQNASAIILSATIVFLSGLLFSIFRIISLVQPENPETGQPEEEWVRFLVNATAWAVVGTALGAIIAGFHFMRKLGHLLYLVRQVSRRAKARNTESQRNVAVIVSATVWQILLTVLRLLANVLACIALPWAAFQSSTGSKPFLALPQDLPLWLAASSLGITIAAAVLFLFVELLVRYKLDPKLGRIIFELFQSEIEEMYQRELEGLLLASLMVTQEQWRQSNAVGKKELVAAANQLLHHDNPLFEQQAWELAARRFLSSEHYRFDTVFAADRFGSIFHYLHRHGRTGAEATTE